MSEERVIRIRQLVMNDLEAVKECFRSALRPEHPNRFKWHGESFWVDQKRHMTVPAALIPPERAKTWQLNNSLRADDEKASDLLHLYGGDFLLENTGSFLRLWARLIAGVQERQIWDIEGAKFINLAVAQPTVNPAFGSIFWLGLADDMGPHGAYRDNIFDLFKPMMFIPARYAEALPSARDVRAAQVSFLGKMFPGCVDSHSVEEPDAVWTAFCEKQLHKHQGLVDERFFEPLLEHVDALDEPGARAFL